MQPGDGARVEPQSLRAVIPAVRSRARDEHSQEHDERTDGDEEPAEHADRPRDQPGQRPVPGIAGAHDQRRHARDDHHGQQEVGGDGARVQPGQDGDAPEDGLGDGADDRDRGQQQQDGTRRQALAAPAPPVDQGSHDGCHGQDDQHEGEQPVAELDVLVPGLLLRGRGGDRPVDALRPGGAPEAGLGDPDDRAGHDDAGLGHEVGQVDAADPLGRASARGGHGRRCEGVRHAPHPTTSGTSGQRGPSPPPPRRAARRAVPSSGARHRRGRT